MTITTCDILGKGERFMVWDFQIAKKYKTNIMNFIGISERVALIQVEFGRFHISIIQAYASTERSRF